VLVVDAATGAPHALIEGSSLTAIRTGAASGAATDTLARPEARVVALFGSGAQARRQLEAVCTVRPIERVQLYSLVGAEAFAAEMAGYGPIPNDIAIAESPRAAPADADIVCAATTSRTPFDGCDVPRHARQRHRLLHTRDAGSTRRRCGGRGSLSIRGPRRWQAGDLITPLCGRARLTSDHVSTTGRGIGRSETGPDEREQITFFKSVGVAVQDAVAAQLVVRNGAALGLGEVDRAMSACSASGHRPTKPRNVAGGRSANTTSSSGNQSMQIAIIALGSRGGRTATSL
jgi:ornithine cyclodeaminase